MYTVCTLSEQQNNSYNDNTLRTRLKWTYTQKPYIGREFCFQLSYEP